MPTTARNPRVAFLALLLGALAIGFVPLFVRRLSLDASAIAFWRVTLAFPVFVVWAAIGKGRAGDPSSPRPAGRDLLALLIPGLFFAADLSTWHVCIRWTSVANATLLANFTPVWMTLAGWLWWRERVTGGFLAGAGLALAGAALLLWSDIRHGPQSVAGDAIGLLAAVFYTGYLLAVKRLRARYGTAAVMAGSALSCALVLLPVLIFWEEHVRPTGTREWAILLAMAWFSHVLGQGLIAWALVSLPSGLSAVGLLVQVLVAAATGWAFLHERLEPVQLLGGAVLLAGVVQARRASRI